jgi:hypothetical protein
MSRQDKRSGHCDQRCGGGFIGARQSGGPTRLVICRFLPALSERAAQGRVESTARAASNSPLRASAGRPQGLPPPAGRRTSPSVKKKQGQHRRPAHQQPKDSDFHALQKLSHLGLQLVNGPRIGTDAFRRSYQAQRPRWRPTPSRTITNNQQELVLPTLPKSDAQPRLD